MAIRNAIRDRHDIERSGGGEQVLEGETPDGGGWEISPDVAEALGFQAEPASWDGTSGGVGVLNELPFGCECADHRAHISDSIVGGKVAERQARNNCVDLWHRFVPQYAAQLDRLATTDAHAGKLAAEESRKRRIAFDDEQTFRVKFRFE